MYRLELHVSAKPQFWTRTLIIISLSKIIDSILDVMGKFHCQLYFYVFLCSL